jgi:hypothetical protein
MESFVHESCINCHSKVMSQVKVSLKCRLQGHKVKYRILGIFCGCPIFEDRINLAAKIAIAKYSYVHIGKYKCNATVITRNRVLWHFFFL